MTNKAYYKISYAQRRLWLIDQFESSGSAYNIFNYDIFEHIEPDLVREAVHYLIERHEVLRTTFEEVGGEPKQVVHESDYLKDVFVYQDFSALSDPEGAAEESLHEAHMQAFDLTQLPLIQVHLIKLDDARFVSAIVVHHIVFDGWSLEVFMRELQEVYQAKATGSAVALKPLTFQYKDYSEHQYNVLSLGKGNKDKTYWERMFEEPIQPINLYPALKRPSQKSYQGNLATVRFSKEQSRALKQFCVENDSTQLIAFISILKIAFYRYSGVDDQVIGTIVSGRESLGLENQVGFYVNTLPLRTQFDGASATFRQVFEKVKTGMMGLFEHQNYPFDLLVDELKIPRRPGQNPLFDFLVTINQKGGQNVPSDALTDDEQILFEDEAVSKFDMTANFSTEGESASLSLVFNPELFPKTFILQFLEHFKSIMGVFVHDPDSLISRHQLVSAEEQQHIRSLGGKVEYGKEKSVREHFREMVRLYPDYRAIVSGDDALTYQQLDELSDKVTSVLAENYQLKPGDTLGINLGRSKEYVVLVLSAVKLGLNYVPIDIGIPEQRIQYMVEKSGCKFLLTTHDLPNYEGVVVRGLEGFFHEVDQLEQVKPLVCDIDHDQTIYTIFTSGSSGKPKGVMVGQQSLLNLVACHRWLVDIKPGDQTALFVSTSFDVTIIEVWPALLSGAAIHILEEDVRNSAVNLAKYNQEKGLDYIFLPASFYHDFSDQDLMPEGGIIITGGEKLKRKGNGKWRLLNSYGPTEATVYSTWYYITKEEEDYPIGQPTWNYELFLLDKQMQFVPKWVTAELYIGGLALAKGYCNDQKLTDEVFIPHPFDASGKVYKTGDLCYYDDDYQLHFVSRANNRQIKLRGYRIELEEIEKNIVEVEGIERALVCHIEQDDLPAHLIAFYMGEAGENVLRSSLHTALPDYMVPSHFIRLEHFPLNNNGKIDQKLLVCQYLEDRSNHLTQRTDLVAPRNETEQSLHDLWKEIFDQEIQISVKDSFFQLGGHSLIAMKLVNRIHNKLEKSINLRDVFSYPTIEKMAEYLENLSESAGESTLYMPLSEVSEDKEDLFCIPPVIGTGSAFVRLAEKIGDDFNVYAFDYPGFQEDEEQAGSIPEIGKIYAALLQDHFEGKTHYNLLGYSLGARIAFDTAKVLEESGKSVSMTLLDRPSDTAMEEEKILNLKEQDIENLFRSEFGFIEESMSPERYVHVKRFFTRNFEMSLRQSEVTGSVKASILAIAASKSKKDMSGWSAFTSGSFIEETVPGSHYEVLSEGNVPIISEMIKAHLLNYSE